MSWGAGTGLPRTIPDLWHESQGMQVELAGIKPIAADAASPADQRLEHGAALVGQDQPAGVDTVYETTQNHLPDRRGRNADLRPSGIRSEAEEQHPGML